MHGNQVGIGLEYYLEHKQIKLFEMEVAVDPSQQDCRWIVSLS